MLYVNFTLDFPSDANSLDLKLYLGKIGFIKKRGVTFKRLFALAFALTNFPRFIIWNVRGSVRGPRRINSSERFAVLFGYSQFAEQGLI